MSVFKLNLYTPENVIARELECSEIVVPTVRGDIDILPEHTHILTELGTGVLMAKSDSGTRHFSVTAGLCRVMQDKVTILSFTSEKPEDIDLERAKSAEAKAKSRLNGEESLNDVELIKFRRKLERAQLRLKLANLK